MGQEYNLFNAINKDGSEIAILEEFPQGANYAFRNKWIRTDKEKVYKIKDSVEDIVVNQLKNLTILSDKEFNELKRRKLAEQSKTNLYVIGRGTEFGVNENYEVELTSEIVANYQNQKFKKYNFNTVGNIPVCGSLHPLMKIREEFKKFLSRWGFQK